jgi:hypothetical protein
VQQFVPDASAFQDFASLYGAIPGAPGAETAQKYGNWGYETPPGTSALLAALYQAFGGDVGYTRSPKTAQKARQQIIRDILRE